MMLLASQAHFCCSFALQGWHACNSPCLITIPFSISHIITSMVQLPLFVHRAALLASSPCAAVVALCCRMLLQWYKLDAREVQIEREIVMGA